MAGKEGKLAEIEELRLENEVILGPVGIILRVPLKREWYPGLKDCRVLEYDTEQQVYG